LQWTVCAKLLTAAQKVNVLQGRLREPKRTSNMNVLHVGPSGFALPPELAEIARRAVKSRLHARLVVATGGATVDPLLQVTRTVPIVFATAFDPIGAGYVESLARPGGNATGFMTAEYSIGGKWLELSRQA
jgi:ABC-type uncharacterized transport system substrate-binding protein